MRKKKKRVKDLIKGARAQKFWVSSCVLEKKMKMERARDYMNLGDKMEKNVIYFLHKLVCHEGA